MSWIKEAFGEQAETLVNRIQNKVVVSEDQHQARLEVCKSCEKYTKHHFCDECHCYMPLKTKFAIFHCPLKKWE